MLRGFRWQLIALILAAAVFIAGMAFRSTETDPTVPAQEEPAATAEATSADIAPVIVPSPLPTQAPNSDQPLGAYREALVGSIQRLNPLFVNLNPVDRDITSLIYEGLTRTNAFGEPVPALAERWVISSDGLEYIVTLRQDVLWQDGIPFSAADVAYTMSLLRSPDFPGSPELLEFWRTVETEQLGEHLIRFRLTQPLGTFLDRLTIGILPEHALSGTTAAQIVSHPINFAPIGTGPYQLEALRSSGDQVRVVDLRVAPVYRQRPEGQGGGFALDRVSFHLYDSFDRALQALQNGDVDGFAARDWSERRPLFNVAAPASMDIQNAVEPTLGAIIFNWENEDTRFFREQRVRVALDTGLDRSSVLDRTLSNLAIRADSPLIPGSWAYLGDLPAPAYNPESARALLQQASDRLERLSDDDGEAEEASEAAAETTAETTTASLFSFGIMTPDDPALINLTGEIATQWSQLGIDVRVDAVDRATYQARLTSGEFEAALVEYALGGSADPDVYAFWHQGQYPDGENYGGADDRRISELLERARREPYGINRIREYHAFQRTFVERAIAIPLYYPLFTYVTSQALDGVQLGFLGTPADRFRTIGDWTIE